MDISKITNKQLTIIFSIIIILVISIFILITMNLKKMNECLDDPFVYGAKQISEKYAEISCSCSILEEGYADFTFNSEGIEFEKNNEFNYFYDNINITDIPIIQND